MTAPGGEDGFKMAGAYVELTVKDDTQAGVDEAKGKIEAGAPAEIPTVIVPPKDDPLRDWKPDPVEVPVEATNPIDAAWLARLNASVKATAADAVNIPATPDTEEYRAELRAALDELAGVTRQDIPVELADADAYKARVMELAESVSAEVQARLHVGLDQESMDKVAAQIEADAKAISTAAQVNLKVNEDASSGSAGGAGGVGYAGAIAGAAVLGAGALGGLALAGVPAIFTAIGVEAEKSSPEVQQAFGGMEAAGKQALELGFAPFIPTFASIANEAKSTLTGLEPSFEQASASAAPLLQTVSTGLLSAVKDGVEGSAGEMQRLGPIATAIGDDFTKGEQGVAGFFKSLDVQDAAQGLEVLGTDVEDVLPAIGSLVTTVSPLSNALLGFLGPAVKDVSGELSVARPLFEATGAVISYLTPEVAALAPPVLAVMGATKLLTGSWTDFGSAGSKVLGVFTNYDSTLESLANKIGLTTASQNAATKAELDAVASKAALVAAADKEAAAAAADAFATDKSAKSELAAADAAAVSAASQKTLADATEAAAAASEEASFAFGPLGIALGVIGLALAPLVINTQGQTKATDDLTGSLQKLEQAAADQASLANLFQTDPNAEAQIALLQKYGVTLQDLASANNGDAAAQQKVADASKQALDAVNAKTDADQKQLDSLKIGTTVVGENGQSYSTNAGAIAQATAALNADKSAQASASSVYGDAKNQLEATTAAQQASASTTALNAQQQTAAATAATNLGLATGTVAESFQHILSVNPKDDINALTTAFMSDTIAVNQATLAISSGFTQADQAVTQAQQSLANANYSYEQSLQGVASAQHSYVQAQQSVQTADQGVVTAQRSLQDAIAGVGTAESNLTKSEVSEQQALVNLSTARQQAAEDLKSLQLQLNDQVESEEAAQLKLYQQQATSAAAGVTSANAQQIAGEQVTSTNQAQIQAALDLISAQNSLADTLNTGMNLRQQVNTATQEGVDGAPGVVSAEQALQNAQDQVASSAQALVKAQQGVITAQQGVVTAEQGVENAYYSEQQAGLAVSNAQHGVQQAAEGVTTANQALTTAQQNASRELDLTSAAGLRNYGMLQTLNQALQNLYGPQEAGNQLIKDTADKFGISTTAAQNYLKQLGLIPANFQFGVTAVASVDLGALENQLHISGTNINLKADGGYITGPGGPRDDKIPTMLSNGEYVVNAGSTAKHLGLLENINKMADGGLVAENVGFGALGVNYQDGVDALTVLGIPHPPGLPAYVAPSAPTSGAGSSASGPVPSVPSSRAANEAIVQSVFASQFGWTGPEWNATVQLLMQESGFNNTAQNPTSTAYGMFQFLNSTWAGYGIPKTSDPTQQSIAGGRYIKARYGDPLGAENHERAYHWFEQGGYLPPGGTLAANGTGRPEMVLPPQMTDTLEQINAGVQGSGGVGHTHNYHITQMPGENGMQLAQRVSANNQWAMRAGRR